jgi:Fe-S-cluster-containing hydrogenase component 2
LKSCPFEYITRDKKTGAIIISEQCTGCGVCLNTCPYGAIRIDPITKKALVCDLCGGDPECVKRCPEDALAYIDAEKATYYRRIAQAKISASR